MSNLPNAFLGTTGQFYFPKNEQLGMANVGPKHARKESIHHVDNRIGWPVYISTEEALLDFGRG
ncbi:hypothetical protein GCM10028805_41320 [Spirosoma harenae]